MEKPGSTSQLAETAIQPMLSTWTPLYVQPTRTPCIETAALRSLQLTNTEHSSGFSVSEKQSWHPLGHALSGAADVSAFLWCSSNLCPTGSCFSSIIIETKYGGDEPITS
jgi:hypothetical protein